MDPRTAAELRELFRRVKRLPPVDPRQPHRFTEDTDEIAAAGEAIVQRALSGRSGVLPFRPRRAVETTVITVGNRRVIVQNKRAAFGI